jgi:hypothetical protein
MWYRVFGTKPDSPDAGDLLAHLNAEGLPVSGSFRGDDLGLSGGELVLPGEGAPIFLERYLTDADEMRDVLNTWAAWLETQEHEPNHETLMRHVVASAQLVTLRKPLSHADDVTLDRLCESACRFLAAGCDGVYQIDGQGFFAADGTLLLREY